MTGAWQEISNEKVIVKDRLTAEQSEIRPRADSKATREVGGCEEMLESWHWKFQSNLQNPAAVIVFHAVQLRHFGTASDVPYVVSNAHDTTSSVRRCVVSSSPHLPLTFTSHSIFVGYDAIMKLKEGQKNTVKWKNMKRTVITAFTLRLSGRYGTLL
jgi:hypothetical protein